MSKKIPRLEMNELAPNVQETLAGRVKRLGYLVEALGREEPGLVAACRTRLSAGVALLDPDGPDDGPRVPAWGIRANVRIAPEAPS